MSSLEFTPLLFLPFQIIVFLISKLSFCAFSHNYLFLFHFCLSLFQNLVYISIGNDAFIYFFEHVNYINLNIFVRLYLALDFLKCLGIFIFRFILSRRLCCGLHLSHYFSLPHSTASTQSLEARCRNTSCSDALKSMLLGDVDTPQIWSQKQQVLPLYPPWPWFLFCFLALTFLYAACQAHGCPCLRFIFVSGTWGLFSSFFLLWLCFKCKVMNS